MSTGMNFLKKNLNAPRPSEHPPVWGKKCQNDYYETDERTIDIHTVLQYEFAHFLRRIELLITYN